MVCKLETNKMGLKTDGISQNILICGSCKLIAHAFVPEPNKNIDRQIHKQPEFLGKSCWQIAHEEVAKGDAGLWKLKVSPLSVTYSVQTKHPICQRLRQYHGLNPRKKRQAREQIEADVAEEKDD